MRGLRLSILVACVLSVAASTTWADEIWIAPTSQQDVGGLEIASNAFWPVTPIGAVRFAFAVPNDLQAFQSAKVVLIPHAPGGAATLNVFVCPAQDGNPVISACAGPFPQAFTGVTNQLKEVDISASVAPRIGTPGSNYLAVLAYTAPTTATDHIVGLRFTYDRTPPSNVATLGANTFTGTQTAPAFAGDGSGLTNLPTPSNVATLGANAFSGTQTAPAFVGDGSGVTNVNATLLDGLDSTAFLHDFGTDNTFVGLNAGNLNMTGHQNTTVGSHSFVNNATGTNNTAIGYNALSSNTAGEFNTASGSGALNLNTTGSNNTANGFVALLSNTTGGFNTALGLQALRNNTSGDFNTAVGHNAGNNATTGSHNIFLGANVMGVGGESNTMYLGKVGTQTTTYIAGVRGTVLAGAEMVVVDAEGRLGSTAAVTPGENTVGSAQVIDNALTADDLAPNAIGTSELAADSVDASKVAFNYAASTIKGGPASDVLCVSCVDSSEVSFTFTGTGANTFTGTQTINAGNLDLDPSSASAGNITKNGERFLHNVGFANTFLGVGAGNLTMTGESNVAVGKEALTQNTNGSRNTATGVQALESNTTGYSNTANGHYALRVNTSGAANTGTGNYALLSNTEGSSNTAIGYTALRDITTGNYNVALGDWAGLFADTGSNNIFLGSNVWGVAGQSNTMYLGKVGQQTKTFIAGVRGTTTVNPDAITVMIDSAGQLGTVSSSVRFKEDIHDMADVSKRLFQLRPVTFRYTQAYGDGSKPIQFGLVAEEVAEVFPELAVREADGDIETVHYEVLNVLLLNEVQKQQRRIETLEQQLKQLLEAR